jgi:hypothetical protein
MTFFSLRSDFFNLYLNTMELPKDPMMLYSVINMKLRDNYKSLDELCKKEDVERASIEKQLATAGFEYSPEHNKFW